MDALSSNEEGGSNHPFHPHKLVAYEPDVIYGNESNEWMCNVCEKLFNVRIISKNAINKLYRCHKCDFDMCSDCYRGYLHPFHEHRLKPATPQMCYPHTKGLWRCDVCQRVYSPFNILNTTEMYHCPKYVHYYIYYTYTQNTCISYYVCELRVTIGDS